jgi:hypothetical protein
LKPLARSVGRVALLGLVGLAAFAPACDTRYSLPPTLCDDHCNATERAECSSDDPADCVRACESESGARLGDPCQPASRAVDDCFLRAESSAFFCAGDHTQPSDICLSERRALSECLLPGSGACFDECLRQDQTCGAKLSDCESACPQTSPACEATFVTYYLCLLSYPVDCGPEPQPDTRDPADIPCYYEALEVLACGN